MPIEPGSDTRPMPSNEIRDDRETSSAIAAAFCRDRRRITRAYDKRSLTGWEQEEAIRIRQANPRDSESELRTKIIHGLLRQRWP